MYVYVCANNYFLLKSKVTAACDDSKYVCTVYKSMHTYIHTLLFQHSNSIQGKHSYQWCAYDGFRREAAKLSGVQAHRRIVAADTDTDTAVRLLLRLVHFKKQHQMRLKIFVHVSCMYK